VIGRETRDDDLRELPFQQPLDLPQLAVLVCADERERLAATAGTTGSPDAVNVVPRSVWQFEVDDVRELIDVEPT
jgi:hypothetical protein